MTQRFRWSSAAPYQDWIYCVTEDDTLFSKVAVTFILDLNYREPPTKFIFSHKLHIKFQMPVAQQQTYIDQHHKPLLLLPFFALNWDHDMRPL